MAQWIHPYHPTRPQQSLDHRPLFLKPSLRLSLRLWNIARSLTGTGVGAVSAFSCTPGQASAAVAHRIRTLRVEFSDLDPAPVRDAGPNDAACSGIHCATLDDRKAKRRVRFPVTRLEGLTSEASVGLAPGAPHRRFVHAAPPQARTSCRKYHCAPVRDASRDDTRHHPVRWQSQARASR